MNIKKRLISVLAICILLAIVVFAGASFLIKDDTSLTFDQIVKHKDTIHLWYTDEALTDYLNKKAVEYNEKIDSDVRVETKLVSGLEYLEAINKTSIDDARNTPDVYLITNDSLEKAYLSGLATEITDVSFIEDQNRFSDTARNAVSYHGKYVGYPVYFETASLLYNKTYLDEIAASGEIQDSSELVPENIVDILNYADAYSAPENVESFFKWDVSDIFYNYFFVGYYLKVGGDAGDDPNNINIYNIGSVSTLKVYQEMSQFFSIEAAETNYDTIMDDFLSGRIIYTIATSDCLKTLEQAQKDGEFQYEYGISDIPGINQELPTKGMSVTNVFVVNGYSEKKEASNAFIQYVLDSDRECELFDMTGKIPAQSQKSYTNAAVQTFQENYEKSVPIPKMLTTSNFWIELESCFAKVWDGQDANTQIRLVSEKINTQVSGEDYAEEPIKDPSIELLPAVEYEDSGEME